MRNDVIGKEWRASCEYSEYYFPFHTLHFDFVCCALAYSRPTFGLTLLVNSYTEFLVLSNRSRRIILSK